MFYDVTVGTSAAGISHILHHSQLLHSMDLPHPYTLSLLRYVYPHPEPEVCDFNFLFSMFLPYAIYHEFFTVSLLKL